MKKLEGSLSRYR